MQIQAVWCPHKRTHICAHYVSCTCADAHEHTSAQVYFFASSIFTWANFPAKWYARPLALVATKIFTRGNMRTFASSSVSTLLTFALALTKTSAQALDPSQQQLNTPAQTYRHRARDIKAVVVVGHHIALDCAQGILLILVLIQTQTKANFLTYVTLIWYYIWFGSVEV